METFRSMQVGNLSGELTRKSSNMELVNPTDRLLVPRRTSACPCLFFLSIDHPPGHQRSALRKKEEERKEEAIGPPHQVAGDAFPC